MADLRIVIVSDLHAAPEAHADESYILLEPPDARRHQHPLSDLLAFVGDRGLRADYVLCPGDITNRSDDMGKVYAWRRLQELKTALGAAALLATPGNHDITTYTPGVDPRTTLRNLSPSYPTGDASRDEVFWRDGMVTVEEEGYRFLILDSCQAHGPHPGEGIGEAEEAAYRERLNRGEITATQLTTLERICAQLETRPVNILMCHHHPKEHQRRALFKDAYGAMVQGDELLRTLEEAHTSGRWLIVHGHKHIPQLVAASGDINSPIVLGAASLGGRLWHPVVTVTRNQFHLLRIPLDPHPTLAPLRGVVESYMWGYGIGWVPASPESAGLPGMCGFGNPVDHRVLATQVRDYMSDHALAFAKWREVVEAVPSVEFQHPTELERFEATLEAVGLELHRDRRQHITEVSRAGD
jgi:metallophosphoesterase superfamily enzyme